MKNDPRFSFGLYRDICAVLEEHGYQRSGTISVGEFYDSLEGLLQVIGSIYGKDVADYVGNEVPHS